MRAMLTDKQRQILRLMQEHHEAHGQWPTLKWLADQTGVSKETMHGHRIALTRKGAIVPIGTRKNGFAYGVADSAVNTPLGRAVEEMLARLSRETTTSARTMLAWPECRRLKEALDSAGRSASP